MSFVGLFTFHLVFGVAQLLVNGFVLDFMLVLAFLFINRVTNVIRDLIIAEN